MVKRGHDVFVVQPLPRAPVGPLGSLLGRPHWSEIARMPRQEFRDGIPIERPRYLHVPGRALANADGFARAGCSRLLGAATCDVVVCDYAWPAARAAAQLRAACLPTLINGRGSDVLQVAETPKLAQALGQCLRDAGNWCAVSQDLVDAMDRLAGGPARGVLVPNGVDLDQFEMRDRSFARQRLGLASEGTLVLVVGHLIGRKDPLLALDAFARAALANARIAFVGAGALRPALDQRARELNLGDRFTLRGEVPSASLCDWYNASDVLLLTSSREGRPNVVLEALACGRPVLATDAGGTAELLVGLPQCLVDSRDPEVIGRALVSLLRNPPTSQRCRAQVEGLSWEQSLDALEGCLARARALERAD